MGVAEVLQIKVGANIHDFEMEAISDSENARKNDPVSFLMSKNNKIIVSTAKNPKKFATP